MVSPYPIFFRPSLMSSLYRLDDLPRAQDHAAQGRKGLDA